MLEILARSAQILLALGGAYLIALWFVLIVWTYRDVESRSNSVFTQVFSTLLTVLFFIPGVLLYLLLRPKETVDEAFQRSLEEEYLLQDIEDLPLCRSCERAVERDWVLCPHCQTELRKPCHSCGHLVDLSWPVCPHCAAAQQEQALDTGERVVPPPPRYLAAGKRRKGDAELGPGVTTAIPASASTGQPEEASAITPVVRPLDRFKPRRQPADAASATAPKIGAGEELLRALEERESAPPLPAGNTDIPPTAQPR